MKKIFFALIIGLFFISCTNYGQAEFIADLPKKLDEVSGITTVKGSDLLWMHNDSGNKSELYGVATNGKIKRVVKVKAKNHDWEDITSDEEGNLYIGDFGNNNNTRKNLVVLKIKYQDLLNKSSVTVEKIKFSYPNQHKFPPKKKDRFFDAESFFYANGSLYIFTKSRVKNNFGKTSLYKIPASKGKYSAQFISDFTTCTSLNCAITSAAISPNKKRIALINHQSILVFSNAKSNDFFQGSFQEIKLGFTSQKEGITFIDNNTILFNDESAHGTGGNLYSYSLNN